jgi:hypothetical protein
MISAFESRGCFCVDAGVFRIAWKWGRLIAAHAMEAREQRCCKTSSAKTRILPLGV